MENNHTYIVLFCWIFVSFSTLVHIAESSNSSEITGLDSDEYAKTINCSLVPERERERLKLDQLIDENNRLIKLGITVKWNQYQPNETYPTDMLWFLATDTAGQHLLLLDDNYTLMSLGTLSYGIATMQLTLKQNPEDCLQDMTPKDADKVLKYTMLTLPQTSKTMNEDGISILHICTGSVNADGSCCNLTLAGEQVRCFLLAKDAWFSIFSQIISAVVFIAFMRSIYLIPKSVYADNRDNSYTLRSNSDDQRFRIKIRMKTLSDPGSELMSLETDETWTKIHREDTSQQPLQQFKDILDNYIKEFKRTKKQDRVYNFVVELKSVKMDDDQLVSECRSSQRLSHSLYKTFSDVFLKCKVRNSYFLRQIFCEPYFRNQRRSVFLNLIVKLFILFFCCFPFMYRITFILKYFGSRTVLNYSVFCSFLVIFSVLVLVLELCNHKKGIWKATKENMVESLRILHKYDREEKMKTFTLITLSPLSFKYYILGIFLVPLSFLVGLIVLSYHSFPICKLPQIIFKLTREMIKKGEQHIRVLRLVFLFLYLSLCLTTVLLIDSFTFYTKCFSYILIGLLLNFDNVSNTILLILIVLTYAFDCFSRAYKQINHFNSRVMKVLNDFFDSENTLRNVLMESENKVIRFNMLSQTGDQFITIQADGEGKPCLSTTGLLLYYKFQDPENLSFMHVSERFFDELASKRGQLSPGPKYMILFEACKEIASLLIALLVVFLIISGFGRISDLSAGINTFVTIGSSTALVMLNKLLFKTDEYSLNDHDSHLKILVERHAQGFRDLWEDTSLKIVDFDIDNEQSVNSQSTEDSDIVIEICHKEKEKKTDVTEITEVTKVTEVTESWYVRPFFPK